MATGAEAQIIEVLFERLSGFSHSPALPVAYPNVKFTPPASGFWLQADFIPNTNRDLYLSHADPVEHRGLLQITVVGPLDVGLTGAMEIALQVSAHFQGFKDFNSDLYGSSVKVSVTGKPSIGGAIKDPPYLRVPVTVPWQSIV